MVQVQLICFGIHIVEYVTVKLHDCGPHLQDVLTNIGPVVHYSTLIDERGNGCVKKQNSNGKDMAFWKTEKWLQQCIFKPTSIFSMDEYICMASKISKNVDFLKDEIEQLIGK
jgi:hypothetical protein